MIRDCGGCNDLGAHKRWCPEVHGRLAARYGSQASKAEALADEVGANCPQAANALYRAAGELARAAQHASDQHHAWKAGQ